MTSTPAIIATALAFSGCASGTLVLDGAPPPGDSRSSGEPTPSGGSGSNGAELVYVATADRQLQIFDPSTLAFTPIGAIDCPNGSAFPWSLTIDRSGVAWMIFSDNHLYRVDTATAHCTPTSFDPSQLVQPINPYVPRIAFVANGPDSPSDTLYLATNTGIAVLDQASLKIGPVLPFDRDNGDGGLAGNWAPELTGTGDGRLYAMLMPGSWSNHEWVLSKIDPSTAHIVSWSPPQGFPGISKGFALVFWGGDAWLFHPYGVDRHKLGTGITTRVLDSLPSVILAAGVSTRAPVEEPK